MKHKKYAPDEIEVFDEEVVSLVTKWRCPERDCDGEMVSNGHFFAINPPLYQHSCIKCGHMGCLRGEKYPKVYVTDGA